MNKSKNRPTRWLTAVLLVFVFVCPPIPAPACGPDFPAAIFAYTKHPDFPLARYTQGELGILEPTYARSYLYVAFRYLAGSNLPPREQKEVLALWEERLRETSYPWVPRDKSYVQEWVEQRAKLSGLSNPPYIDTYKSSYSYAEGDEFWFRFGYSNCNEDSFRVAVETLRDRAKRFGPHSPDLQSWVSGQDAVYANCAGPGKKRTNALPSPLTSGAPLLVADRAYQTAAAYFYAEDFDEALGRFKTISQDAASPWRKWSAYLVARCLIRKAILEVKEEKERMALLQQAQMQLLQVLKDPDVREAQTPALEMLNYVQLQLNPQEGTEVIAARLMRPRVATLRRDLDDYTRMLDRFLAGVYDDPEQETPRKAPTSVENLRRRSELTDWILTFQGDGKGALNLALRQWEKKQSFPWLVAAISKVPASHSKASALIAAAEKVPVDSPTYATVTFHRLRLLGESGQAAQARNELDSLLAGAKGDFPPSARNQFLGLRKQLAQHLGEFLRFSQRSPVMVTDDVYVVPEIMYQWRDLKKLERAPAEPVRFDVESARQLTETIPLDMLIQAVESETLAPHLRREIATTAWVRAILLADHAKARKLASLAGQLVPEMKASLDEYLAAPAEAEQFVSALVLLRFPGVRPYVAAGVGHRPAIARIDSYRDNWWCDLPPRPKGEWQADYYGSIAATYDWKTQEFHWISLAPPSFLSASQKAQAQEEWKELRSMKTAPNLLAKIVLEWSRKHPEDARVPEALHLVVRATRYGCTDAASSKFSRAAFQLLHRRYPKSEWTKKTPFWF